MPAFVAPTSCSFPPTPAPPPLPLPPPSLARPLPPYPVARSVSSLPLSSNQHSELRFLSDLSVSSVSRSCWLFSSCLLLPSPFPVSLKPLPCVQCFNRLHLYSVLCASTRSLFLAPLSFVHGKGLLRKNCPLHTPYFISISFRRLHITITLRSTP